MQYVVMSLLQAAGVTLLAVLGAVMGRWFSRLPGRKWMIGYFIPLVLVFLVAIARWFPKTESLAPFRWLMADRLEFAAMSMVCTLLLVTPLSRLRTRGQRIAVGFFMVFSVVYYSILPFLLPALTYAKFSAMPTVFGANGVCMQSTGYNCGPAAAVTVLRKLGIPAEEGDLAIRSYTSTVSGTPPDSLCSAMRKAHGVDCRIVHMERLDDLRGMEPCLAIIKYTFGVDHYVAVLAVTDSEVIVGDPLNGQCALSRAEFLKKWRKMAIKVGVK